MKKYIILILAAVGVGAIVGTIESFFKILVNQANWYRAVSYTHLDVYKRQIYFFHGINCLENLTFINDCTKWTVY